MWRFSAVVMTLPRQSFPETFQCTLSRPFVLNARLGWCVFADDWRQTADKANSTSVISKPAGLISRD